MLALATGWTPEVIGQVSDRFRRACHWAIYARTIAGPKGLPSIEIPANAPMEQRLAIQSVRADVLRLRSHLFPEDGDGTA